MPDIGGYRIAEGLANQIACLSRGGTLGAGVEAQAADFGSGSVPCAEPDMPVIAFHMPVAAMMFPVFVFAVMLVPMPVFMPMSDFAMGPVGVFCAGSGCGGRYLVRTGHGAAGICLAGLNQAQANDNAGSQ